MFSMIVYNWWIVCSSRVEPRTGEGIRYPLGSHQQRPNFQKSLFYKMFLGCENLTCVSSKKFSVHSKDTLAACAVKVEASLRCSWFRTNILSKKPTIKIFSSTRIYSLTTLPGIHWKGAPFLGDSTLFNLHSRLSVAWMICSIGKAENHSQIGWKFGANLMRVFQFIYHGNPSTKCCAALVFRELLCWCC